MEQELRTWLRVCIFFGIYVGTTLSATTQFKATDYAAWRTSEDASKRAYHLQRFYNGFLCCGICVLFVASIHWYAYPKEFALNFIATTILFATRFIATALILMEAMWKKQQHDAFLDVLQEIDVSMRLRLQWNGRSTELLKHLQYFLRYQLALSLLGMLPFVLMTCIVSHYEGYFWQGLWFICTTRLRTLQLLVYMQILRHYLEGLCVKLQQIVAYHMAPSRQLLDVNYGRLGKLEYFYALNEIYTLFHSAFELLNDFAGWSLCGITISYMLDLSSNFYWLLQSFDNFHGRRYYYWGDLWWFIPVTWMVWYMCYLCDNCKRLGCMVAHLLSKIIFKSSTRSMLHYRLVLHQFSMQVQQQRIVVSAQIFFVLDLRFICLICTVMAMHLVILLQF